jgi:AAA domain
MTSGSAAGTSRLSNEADSPLTPSAEQTILEERASDSGAAEFSLTATGEDGLDYGPDHVPGQLLDWARLERPLRPRTWFMGGWLTTGPLLFAARGGTGKSLELQTMCTAIATGKDYLGPVEKARPCLIWSCEDDVDEILRRQDCINKHFKVSNRDLGQLHLNPRVGLENILMELVNGKLASTAVLKQLREQVNDVRAEVLVLDNVAHIYGGLDDRTQVTKFVSTITAMVTDRPFAIIFVTHVPKSQGTEYAGTIAWENAVRMRWLLVNGEDQDLVHSINKSNVSGLDSIKLRIVDSVVVPKSAREVADSLRRAKEAQLQRDEYVESIVINGLEMLRDAKVRVCAKAKSSEGLVKLIGDHEFESDASKKELNDALSRLERAKCVETGSDGHKYTNGSPYIEILKIRPRDRSYSITVDP